MTRSLSFQEVIMRLQAFWASQNCVIWQPYNVQIGAGTLNPATSLRVLGPEPWNVAYVEPSIRPDDGRFGNNPNRMQQHYQFQVILKPDPGNPQELYLQSLEAIGINRREHDIRFVEDNWASPALGAWGLGWEVWLDGQEITQFTYFQQAGGIPLDPVAVEITYGLERIVLALQGVNSVWEIEWAEGIRYGEILLSQEIEHCEYYFNVADVDALREVYNTYEREAERALEHEPPLVITAHDYVLKCSHLFNVLDTRGAIGVVERADYFRRMQRQAARVARAYVDQRRRMEFPWVPENWMVDVETGAVSISLSEPPSMKIGAYPRKPASFVLEIGVEELPAADLVSALEQLRILVPAMLEEARLVYDAFTVSGTPRRLVVGIEDLAPNQRAEETIRRGPPVKAAFDAADRPTKAAEGFARSAGIAVSDLEKRLIEGGEYVVALVRDEGRPTSEVLSKKLPELIAAIRFDSGMRWNWSGISFSRPLRWYVALYGHGVIPFQYAGIDANRFTRGTRPLGSPAIELADADSYFSTMDELGIIIDPEARKESIAIQVEALAASIGGTVRPDPNLLDEVANLVEQPTALLGTFDKADLTLPEEVLITVMRKHQRYFAVVDKKGRLLPAFIAVRNGDAEHLGKVIEGNEHVIRARFADARFFYNEDIRNPLSSYLDRIKTLTFQESIGSYYDKAVRLEGLSGRIGALLGLQDDDGEMEMTIRAARLAKADLGTKMVVEMTSLQGIMGRYYALASGEPEIVAKAIAEHYYPRYTGDVLPQTVPGIAIALADRLDSLVGLFSAGLQPTGSADPFGLRRAALGIVQIALGRQLDFDLRELITWTAQGFTREFGENTISGDVKAAVLDFIAGRLRVALRERYRYDIVEAVLAAQAHNPYRADIFAGQLAVWITRQNWQNTLDAYARCVRITRSLDAIFTLKPEALAEPVEKNLYTALVEAEVILEQEKEADTLLSALESMAPTISAFFAPAEEGGVLVMHSDRAVRENRLALLQRIAALAVGIADLSQLEGF